MSTKIYGVFICICVFCGFANAQQAFSLQSLILNSELIEDSNAIIRNDSISIELDAVDDMKIYKEFSVTVLNKLGERFVESSEYFNEGRNIKSLEAYIYDQSGNEIKKFRKKDFRERSAVPRGQLYSDDRVLFLDYTPTFYPYTIKFISEVKTTNTVFIPSWFFVSGYNVGVEKSVFRINDKANLGVRFHESNFNGFSIEKEKNDSEIIYKATNLSAIKSEELSPNFSKIVPALHSAVNNFFIHGVEGYATNWEEMGKWMNSYILKDRAELPSHTVNYINSLVDGVENPMEKAKIIYKYVQEQTRYIGVQVGIGGIQPIAASEVDQVKYGDCKGLSNYTLALLKAVGVDAYYVHVQAGAEKIDFIEDFASLNQGNHAILAIPNNESYCWIDCTSRIHPFNFVGDFTDNRKVLVMKPEGGEIMETMAYLNGHNQLKSVGSFQLNENNSITASVAMTSTGIMYDNHFYLGEKSAEDQIKAFKEYWGHINNLDIKSLVFENNEDEISFVEKSNFSAENYGSITGERIIFEANLFNRISYVPKRYKDREMPFEVSRGFAYKDDITIKILENYEVEAMPEEVSIINEFGNYTLKLTKINDGELHYEREFLLKSGFYEAQKYKDYRDFRKQVSKLENAKIVLIKKT
ncbi:DUF3857 domain-containing protein [Galbibacter sp. BG1]|uniref:DUF3857 domain-containing protein n=1 Tax=Galbibacter sp. BG1 TaxID=1170699 RepID=UPI0015B794B3|nr:DUF3857 domain-containing protein [Galbibacter sp. BG1]QLE01782.1 DUF3857 domain-containing protein [Galbibacter sp. BG1]